MKKNLIMLLLLLWAGHSLYAQQAGQQVSERKNLWRTEIGTAFTGTGDLRGSTMYLEYGRYLTSRFRASPSVGVWLFQRNDENSGLFRSAMAKSFDLTGYYEVLQIGRVKAEVGAGGFARSWNWAYATGPSTGFSNGELNLSPGSYGTIAENTFGYTISAGASVGLTDIISWNVRATLQNDTGGNTALTARAGFNIRF